MSKQSKHLRRVSLKNDNVYQEVIVMKEDGSTGDIYYIATNELDVIDRQRMIKILNRRDSDAYPLYDLLANETLANGMNALEYFHQLVKIRTLNGDIFAVNSGKTGALLTPEQRQQHGLPVRGPGRPPKQAQPV